MKICQKCNKKFPILVKIDGKNHNLCSRKFCLNCSPFGEHNTSKNLYKLSSTIDKISIQEFKTLVNTSKSRSDILFKLKLRKSGSSFKILNDRLIREKIDISHFKRGYYIGINRIYNDNDVYCENSKIKNIRPRVFNDNFMEYKCKKCELIDSWNNKKLSLHLDHINGNRYDNRKENLRWLCPNCHSQTETYCGNRKE